jgi:hypothetical protein
VNFLPAYVLLHSTSVSTYGRLAHGRGCTATAATSRGRLSANHWLVDLIALRIRAFSPESPR